MVRIFPLFLALLLCGCGASSRRKGTEVPPSEHRRGIVLRFSDSLTAATPRDTIRFGRLHSGETAQLEVWLRNETDRPVVICDTKRNCGCVTLHYTSEPIPPRGERRLTLDFNSRGEWGWQLKTLDVVFAGEKQRVRLLVDAEIE